MSKWEKFTKEELIKHIQRLEKTKVHRKKYSQRPFDFNNSVCRPIALRIAYLGHNYHGFSTSEDDVDTIEAHLFRALQTSKLIPSTTGCGWAKCGRTDKGVSAFGQTCSLWIRSKLPANDPRVCSWDQVRAKEDYKHLAVKNPEMQRTYNFHDELEDELNYLGMLNRLLPDDIRVLAWSPVSDTFDARFSCSYRLYHYYFPSEGLDLEAMKDGASRFVGIHDCRHICKIDSSKAEKQGFFIRTILEAKIEQVAPGFCIFIGQAFLWHQVRNMMALLFMIGKKQESPRIVSDMLDLNQHPEDGGKPTYKMADDSPLCLVDCGYHSNLLKWRTTDGEIRSDHHLMRNITSQLNQQMIKTLQLQQLQRISMELGAEHGPINFGKHVPLWKRPRCDSVNTMIEKSKKKKPQ